MSEPAADYGRYTPPRLPSPRPRRHSMRIALQTNVSHLHGHGLTKYQLTCVLACLGTKYLFARMGDIALPYRLG